MPDLQLVIESSPHIRGQDSVERIMWTVLLALLPAAAVACYIFGPRVMALILVAIAGAWMSEALAGRWREGVWRAPADGSIIITGLLLALTLPPSFPFIETFIGGVVACVFGKQVFGGLGYNIFNPALVGRAFLQAAFPVEITTWTAPVYGWTFRLDGLTGATPLAKMKFEHAAPALRDLFLGTTAGSLGETSALAIMLGGLFLLWKRYIDWRVPAVMLGTVALFTGLLHAIDPVRYVSPWAHLFAGGLMLGAWFMATDMVTTPLTSAGRVTFAFGCGVLVVVIRVWGGLPEGVMYSILLMNACTPLINRWMVPRRFDERRHIGWARHVAAKVHP